MQVDKGHRVVTAAHHPRKVLQRPQHVPGVVDGGMKEGAGSLPLPVQVVRLQVGSSTKKKIGYLIKLQT